MESITQHLVKQALPPSLAHKMLDYEEPLSFQEWKKSRTGIIPSQEYNLYNQYLTEWYTVKKQINNNNEQDFQTRINYLSLLKELQLFFSNQEKDRWYKVINFSNNDDILNTIPYFAKKLKEIALYFNYVRKKLKNTKLQYNLGGTNTSFELEIHEHLLNRYTQSEFNTLQIPRNISICLPELDEIKKSLVVKVEEVYDDFEYQDQSNTLPVSAYFNLHDPTTKEFFNTKNIDLLNDSWVFINTPDLSGTYFDSETNLNLAENYLKKYSGYNKHTGEVTKPSLEIEKFDIQINTGDNLFNWPNNFYKTYASPTNRLVPIPLTATTAQELGTAGTDISTSDTIFIQTKNNLQGAWLSFQKHETENKLLKAKFEKKSKTEFKFPYPGFGLSGVGVEWTGPSYEYLPEFFSLKDTFKKLIETEYWGYTSTTLTVSSINIQDTTLIDQKAYASTSYPQADKIKIVKTPPFPNESSYAGDIEISWLYKFTKTDLPIAPNTNTIVYWPYERIEGEELPNYYPKNVKVCDTVSIQNLDINYQIVSNVFEGADKIYKINSPTDTLENATECAWLSGTNVLFTNSKIITTPQPCLSFIADSGTCVKFIWQGDNLTDINNVIKFIPHKKDCPYNDASSLEYNKCSCHAVNFTPYGHHYNTIDDSSFNEVDIIVECTDFNDISTLDIANWRDSFNKNYKQSLNFAWYKTHLKKGFFSGAWVTETFNGIPRFKKGSAYIYLRAKPEGVNIPSLALRYKYSNKNSKEFVWVSATKQNNGTWLSDDKPSNMVLKERDLLIYARSGSVVSAVSGTIISQNTITENKRNIWANYDYVSIARADDPLTLTSQKIYLSYPETNFTNPTNASITLGNGIPPINSDDVLGIAKWLVTDPTGAVTQYENTDVLSFIPFIEGVYSVVVDIKTGTPESFTRVPNSGGTTSNFNISAFSYTWTPEQATIVRFSGIPPITAVGYFQTTPSLTGINTPQPGFVLNTNLFGWDYSTAYQRSVATPGARPFWGKATFSRENYTQFGSIPDWSTSYRVFDTHNIVTQPLFSVSNFDTGYYVEYDRKSNTSLIWEQPITVLTEVNKKQWRELSISYEPTNLKDILSDNVGTLFNVQPLSSSSLIFLTNYIDNHPVTVLYKALTPFTWSISAVPEIETYTITEKDITPALEVERPWNQFANRFNATSPTIPTLQSIYTKKDTGGYFIPNNLGVSVYNANNFTYTLNTTAETIIEDFVKPDYFFGGRGNSKKENSIPYKDLSEDATWLKESFNSNVLAGNINRKVSKEYQKFIPYQTTTDSKISKQTGINILNKKLTPWTGRESKEWGDNTNVPGNAAGIYNASVWAEEHILQSNDKQIYNWVTDIFGNQYTLLKDIKNSSPYEQKNIPGELWVQKTSKVVQPAYKALSGVFDTYKGLEVYSELTGGGIRKIDMFFDTLYIETSSAIFLEKINYEYERDNIYSFVDSSHIISLIAPISIGLRREFNSLTGVSVAQVGDTWFFPEQKIVLLSICELSSNQIIPHLFELDIVNETFSKVFPI